MKFEQPRKTDGRFTAQHEFGGAVGTKTPDVPRMVPVKSPAPEKQPEQSDKKEEVKKNG